MSLTLRVSEAELGHIIRALSDRAPLGYTPTIEVHYIGLAYEVSEKPDKDPWYYVKLTRGQVKTLMRHVPPIVLAERYKSR